MSNEYGSDEYYEETGKNGTTINTKKTEGLPAYDKKLFYLDSFFKKMVYSNAGRSLTTYSNFYYKDNDGKIYYWHRKRKGKYACMPGGSIIYIDAEASMERFTGEATTYSVIEKYIRAPVFHGMINGIAYYTVVGSSKFDNEDEVWIAKSEDGLLIEPILNIHEKWTQHDRYYNCLLPNHMGKLGHFERKLWRKEDDPNPNYNMRNKVFVYNYNGLNYTINIIATDLYGDGDLEPVNNWQAKGELYEISNIYPLFVYRYEMTRYTVGSSGSYDPSINDHYFCDMFSSQYILYIAYYWYRIYNANTNTTEDLPFVTFLNKIGTRWRTNEGGYYKKIMDPKSIPDIFLKCLGIMPYFDVVAICPNGNILVSIIYHCDPRIPKSVIDEYPEYGYFSRFFLTPKYYVIDFNSGKWIESNIQEPDDYDTSTAEYSEVSVRDDMRPAYVYTDGEYGWFRKLYREETDITFYGTKDGYNIDKRIVYYNRTTIPITVHEMITYDESEYVINVDENKAYFKYTLNNGWRKIVQVPVYENGIFKEMKIAVGIGNGLTDPKSCNSALMNDLKPESDGRLHQRLISTSANNQRYDRYRVRYTKKQPGQTDDDYIYEIE